MTKFYLQLIVASHFVLSIYPHEVRHHLDDGTKSTYVKTDLAVKALEGVEPVKCQGHESGVVGDIRAVAERTSAHGVRQRLVQLLKPLHERLLGLLRRPLQIVHP